MVKSFRQNDNIPEDPDWPIRTNTETENIPGHKITQINAYLSRNRKRGPSEKFVYICVLGLSPSILRNQHTLY